MASAAQALANATNAQKSTGPRTEAGKSNSRQNSMAHGLNAEASTLFSHSPYLAEEFQNFRAQLLEYPTKGKTEELAFDRWAFSAFQANRARQMEAMAESDARVNYGDDHFERRWQRMVQTRLRLDRDAATARKEFLAMQDQRLFLEAENAAEEKRTHHEKQVLEILRLKANQRDQAYQSALRSYQKRLQAGETIAGESIEAPPAQDWGDELALCSPDMATYNDLIEAEVDAIGDYLKETKLMGSAL